jgi:predicted porin
MKKTVIGAVLAGVFAVPAMAQSQVQVYGLVDSGLVYTTNTDATGKSLLKMPSLTGSFPSRLGFRGTEDLGNGLQAVFNLEAGLLLDTGMMGQGNRLFGRQASVGLKSALGTVTLGRQVNMTYYSALKTDVMGPNLFSISSLDAYIPNARSDNAVGYMGAFNEFTVGATYSFGRDASAAGGPAATGCAGESPINSKACRQITALLGYDNKRFGVTASYDKMHGNTGAAAGLATPDSYDQRVTLNGYAMLGTTKIGAGMIDREKRAATVVNNLDSELFYLGASHPLTAALQLDGQVAVLDVKGSDNDSTLAVLRLTYNLSKRTGIYSAIGRMKNDGTAAVALDAGGTVGAGLGQSGIMAGIKHAF